MKKCDACGKRFRLRKENRYVVTEMPYGFDCLSKGSTFHNAFDCPHCGCQNIIGEIKVSISRSKEEKNLDEVLEKIKDDIKHRYFVTLVPENNRAISVHDVIQIIDKYKKEE